MRIVQQLRFSTHHLFTVGISGLIIAAIVMVGVGGAFADITLGGGQNCDANAVVYCGASSASQLSSKYNSGDGHNSPSSIANIYNYFGITNADIQSLSTTAVAGSVTKSGEVYVNGQVIATNAETAGRQNIAGSTVETDNGTTFYARPPSVSFENESLNAYVVMVNGTFSFAILSSCGNPVKATPTIKPVPTPKPMPVPPAPAGVCNGVSLTQNSDNPRSVSALVSYSVSNGATLHSVHFNWGDTSTTNNGTTLSASHQYKQGGDYNVTATLSFAASKAVPAVTCQAPITIVTQTPICAGLDIKVTNNTITISNFTYDSNNSGATFDHATLDWGDGSPIVSSSTLAGQTHTYTSFGDHTITATSYFSSDGVVTPYTGQNCQQLVSFVQPTTPATPSTPAPPTAILTSAPITVASRPQTSLINTGPGDVIGIFLGTSVAGAFVYRRWLGRKLSR